MKKQLLILGLVACIYAGAQTKTPKDPYQAVPEKINDLVHTRLDAGFDFDKSQLKGKVVLTLRPHFYPTDSLTLDAKGMEIASVELVQPATKKSLPYQYNGTHLRIRLPKTYTRQESYQVAIQYVAKPNELEAKGSAAITDAKGLYFINPKGEEKDKPTQVWTQGETEATSVWVPTIDKTNQKSTQDFYLRVPAKFVSLSNGRLIQQTKNSDGTRTDRWVMDQPHAPYLFFIGMGDFAVIKDSYKGKEVSYYVEKPYAPVARRIFGQTPAMMAFFSQKLGVDYPWAKYSQMVGRDYVSGAMENTTATLHQESAQQDARELVDGNSWEGTVAHELFHHWFGDYVTAESWSNITVNESFADYSEFLWAEHAHGPDEAAFENFQSTQAYLADPSQASKDLVRFHYADKEEVFDQVSYQKGGRILHMLRNYLGDAAFFAGLNKYLTDNRFGNGSAHKLRLALEAVSGKDLNWFFNQWYFGNGHPKLNITYGYDAEKKMATVFVKQNQGEKIFTLPVDIDVYEGGSKKRHSVWLRNKADSFYFPVTAAPQLVNFDPERVVLAEKTSNKTKEQFFYQFEKAKHYMDRRESIEFAGKSISDPASLGLVLKALDDPYFRIRVRALITLQNAKLDAQQLSKIQQMAQKDPSGLARAQAVTLLAKTKDPAYAPVFAAATHDSSYSVAGAGLEAWLNMDPKGAFARYQAIKDQPAKGALSAAITKVLVAEGGEADFEAVMSNFAQMPLSVEKVNAMENVGKFLAKVNDETKFKKGVDQLLATYEEIPAGFRGQFTGPFNNNVLKPLATAKTNQGQTALAAYVTSKLVK